MLFSIVIPVYNVEKYLDSCLETILPQIEMMENECEILLIDDGSTDKSGEICDKYATEYSKYIKVYHKKNEGLLLTRRYGYKRATGQYIINCDSDDLIEANMLEEIRKIICNYNNPDIIIINHNIYDDGKKTVAYENVFSKIHDCRIQKQDVLREFMLKHSIVSVWGKIIKRSCINLEINYYYFGKLSTGEDTLQSIEFFSNAKTFVYLNEALYNYRCRSGMTSKFDFDYFFTFKKIFEEIKKYKDDWNLKDFDELFAIKVLQTTGRAITQSRYKKWKTFKEHKGYLKLLYFDSLFQDNIHYINMVKDKLQYNHYVLIRLLMNEHFNLIIMLLGTKNVVEMILQ